MVGLKTRKFQRGELLQERVGQAQIVVVEERHEFSVRHGDAVVARRGCAALHGEPLIGDVRHSRAQRRGVVGRGIVDDDDLGIRAPRPRTVNRGGQHLYSIAGRDDPLNNDTIGSEFSLSLGGCG
ncbi:hypothetical protein [Sphingomonas sp. CROZ-RG-20F-R02-07]|uniref:hypothetical protein n=1 Tax=Sphingomonas sp. CROZ-RG-20F-R02-07 TaxID=2914832 RepID=UPI001F5673CF|nr:hypothetical protein [Sphingomonas sp. CROZ-RG-20F-R02-07]